MNFTKKHRAMKTANKIRNIFSLTERIFSVSRKAIFFCNIFFIHANTIAEGTKQLMPLDTNHGNIQIFDHKRPFAAFYNTDTLHRLYFHIKNTSEKVYFGFNHIHNSGNNSTTKFRIKDPSGNIVYAATNIPTVAGSGYISTYAQAIAGTKVNGSPAAGYSPMSYSPVTTGDFYIEFMTDTTKGTYHLDYFDLTIIDGSGKVVSGRLWSYCWDLSSRSYSNTFCSKMYVLSNDGSVACFDFNGCQPYGFTVTNSSTGVFKTGNAASDRKSINGKYENPQFKVFLNNPDPTVYPSGTLPQVVSSLKMIGDPIYGEPIKFTINVNKAGTLELLIDLNGTSGYQQGTADADIVQYIKAGVDTITWNGKDGLGNYVAVGGNVQISSKYSTGVRKGIKKPSFKKEPV